MIYGIEFKGDDVKSAGSIFQMEGQIYLSGGNGTTVRIDAQIYHKRMREWIDNRMKSPLVFVDGTGARCTMNAPAGGGDVEIELTAAKG
jgi:hypothetical protein